MFSSFWVGIGVAKVDLVWGTSPPIFQGVTAWLLARLKGARFLFEVRDLWPAFAIAVGVLRNPALIGLSLWLERFLYRRADQMVVNSPGYLDHVKERGARKVTLIPNGADLAMFVSVDHGTAFRSEHGLEGDFVALYAGAHGLSNDLGVILKAAEILKGQPGIRFVFVGDGKEKSALQASATALGLDRVIFLPSVAKNEMAGVIAAADACVAILKPLELYKTTYPNKVFDYMAAGKPVLLVIDGVIREVVKSAQAGIFIPPGNAQALADAVLRLAKDPALGRKMGDAGQKAIQETYNRGHFSEQFAQLLENMR